MKKRDIRLLGGAAAVSAALFVVSGMAHGLESRPLETTQAPVHRVETRILVAQADAPAQKATYTSEQADRGESLYTKNCEECHGKDLRGGLLGGPPLRGVAFEEKYAKGAPAGALFDFMSVAMPPDSPGRFSAAQYADIMAYILKRNSFKAGAELPSDSETLYNYVIEK